MRRCTSHAAGFWCRFAGATDMACGYTRMGLRGCRWFCAIASGIVSLSDVREGSGWMPCSEFLKIGVKSALRGVFRDEGVGVSAFNAGCSLREELQGPSQPPTRSLPGLGSARGLAIGQNKRRLQTSQGMSHVEKWYPWTEGHLMRSCPQLWPRILLSFGMVYIHLPEAVASRVET